MAHFRASALSKSYGHYKVINDLDINVAAGEVLGLIGKSGSGKSTLLRVLALLESPDFGNAWIGETQFLSKGEMKSDPVAIRRRITLVFQDHNLLPNLTVLDNCTLALRRNMRIARASAEQTANEILNELGVNGLERRYPDSLSGGQAQRVAIARALLMQPDVMLLDEVTSALDPDSTNAVLETLERVRSLKSADGLAIVLVTHHLRFASRFATRIGVLEKGKIVEAHPAGNFGRDASSLTARSFLQWDEMF